MALAFDQEQYAQLQRAAEKNPKGKFFGKTIEGVRNFFTRRSNSPQPIAPESLQETPEAQQLTRIMDQQVDQQALHRQRIQDKEREQKESKRAEKEVALARTWQAPEGDFVATFPRWVVEQVVKDAEWNDYPLSVSSGTQVASRNHTLIDAFSPRQSATSRKVYELVPQVTQPLEEESREQKEQIIGDLFHHLRLALNMSVLPRDALSFSVQEAYIMDNIKRAFEFGRPNAFATARLSREEDAVFTQIYRKALNRHFDP